MESREKLSQSVNAAIEKALDFLRRRQLPSGAFRTTRSSSPSLEKTEVVRSPFITTFVLHSVNASPNISVNDDSVSLGIEYILSECEAPGVWRFFGKGSQIPADLDDTCCALAVLKEFGSTSVDFHHMCEYLMEFRDSSGLFYTWMNVPASLGWLRDPIYDTIVNLDLVNVDPVVNANALFFYLLMDHPLETITDHLTRVIREMVSTNMNFRSIYYLTPQTLLYAVSRAFSVHKSVDAMRVERVKPWASKLVRRSLQRTDVLGSAMTLSASIDLDINDNSLSLATSILRQQNRDGGWDAIPFFIQRVPQGPLYYASEELTTALCLEALAKFVKSFLPDARVKL